MTNLGEFQRGMLGLLKGRSIEAAGDPYLQLVAGSNELRLAREIVLWWRAFHLETYCVFTARLLARLGIFDQVVETYFRESSTSPFIEKLSHEFLAWISMHEDPLVSSVASFERALLRVAAGDSHTYTMEWNRNPENLLSAIMRRTDLPPVETSHSYVITISTHIPKFISCERIEKRHTASDFLSRAGRGPNSRVLCMDSRRATN